MVTDEVLASHVNVTHRKAFTISRQTALDKIE